MDNEHKEHKLVFSEESDRGPFVYYTDEYTREGGFIEFYDEKTDSDIVYSEDALIKIQSGEKTE